MLSTMILNARILARRTVQPHRCFGSSTQSALSLPSQSARKANAEALASHAPDVTKFFQFSFHDLFGVQRSKLVPAAAVKDLAVGGAGFAGFAAHLDMDPTNGDLLAIPDASTCVSLPWNPSVAWVACDLEWDGAPLAHGPRNVLRGALDTLREASGFTLKTGVECEFFLLDGNALFLSGYTRNATIANSSFSYIGDNAMAAWGYTAEPAGEAHDLPAGTGMDGTGGEQPRYTTVIGAPPAMLSLL